MELKFKVRGFGYRMHAHQGQSPRELVHYGVDEKEVFVKLQRGLPVTWHYLSGGNVGLVSDLVGQSECFIQGIH